MCKNLRVVAVNEIGRRIGQDHPGAKLTDADVELIRDLHECEGFSYRALAEKFGVSKMAICHIVKFRRRNQHPAAWRGVNVT